MMVLWEGILASFTAGVLVSVLNRFGLSQIQTPCERRKQLTRAAGDSSSESSEREGGMVAAVCEVSIHHAGGGE